MTNNSRWQCHMKYVWVPEERLKVHLSWNPVTRGGRLCFSSPESCRLDLRTNLYPSCRIFAELLDLYKHMNERGMYVASVRPHLSNLKSQQAVCDRFGWVRKIKRAGNINHLGSFEQFEHWCRACRRITALFSSWLTKKKKEWSSVPPDTSNYLCQKIGVIWVFSVTLYLCAIKER